MKKLLPALAVLALAGCANLDATVADPEPAPAATESASSSSVHPDAPYEREMLACRYDTDECAVRAVLRSDTTAYALKDDAGSWISVAASECVDARCVVTDEHGTKWLLE